MLVIYSSMQDEHQRRKARRVEDLELPKNVLLVVETTSSVNTCAFVTRRMSFTAAAVGQHPVQGPVILLVVQGLSKDEYNRIYLQPAVCSDDFMFWNQSRIGVFGCTASIIGVRVSCNTSLEQESRRSSA